MGKIIYVTGAPATGKSTLTKRLTDTANPITVFTYSKELADTISERTGQTSQNDLREKSGGIVTREDVNQVDKRLINTAPPFKSQPQHLIIDSHPVTIESYGFRVTPFSKEMLTALSPDIIVCLYASAEVLTKRIKSDPAGRPLPSKAELDRHVAIQAQVASMYAFETGASLYYLDAGRPPAELLKNFLQVTRLADDS